MGLLTLTAEGRIVRPTVEWFAWASLRAKLSATVHFVNEMRKDVGLLYIAKASEQRFLNEICRHGIVRTVGKHHGWYWDGQSARNADLDDGMIYQSIDRTA